MHEGQRPSLREILGNKLKTWGYQLQEMSPNSQVQADTIRTERERIAKSDGFIDAVNTIKDILSLDEIVGLQGENEQKLYREQLITESTFKILADPFFTHPVTGQPLKLDKDKKQHWQNLYCQPRRSSNINNNVLVMLEGEIAAAAKTTAHRLLRPEFNLYGQILVERLTGTAYQPLNVEQLQAGAQKDITTLQEDPALQKHASQIALFRGQLS